MKQLTPVKLPSSAKSHQKALKCTVYLDIHAITCPGALLGQPEDVYLSVCVLGQYRKTHCLPPVFPLLFNHKMVFVRTFPGVVDPADVSEQLESDTSTFELIQMVPPEGEVLATAEETTRDFAFPGPRLASREEAPEREILMRKSSSFPGIAPIVEFATTAVIQEMNGADSLPTTPLCGLHPVRSSPPLPRRSSAKTTPPPRRSQSQPRSPASPPRAPGHPGNRGPPKSRGRRKDKTADPSPSPGPSVPPPPLTPPVSPRRRGAQRTGREGRGQPPGPPGAEVSRYCRPTAASVSRALSPYTHRRMCQLSEDARARLAHLQLGPHHFRKQTRSRPPFLVPLCGDVSVTESASCQRVSSTRESSSARVSAEHPGIALDLSLSLLGSYRPKLAVPRSGSSVTGRPPDVQGRRRGDEAQPATPREAAWSVPGASSSSSPLSLGHLSLKERFHGLPSGPTQWEQIHSRVQRILRTHGTSPKRPTEEEEEEEEEEQRTGGLWDGARCGHQLSEDRGSPGECAEGLYGGKQASRDGLPRPHRAAFEESLGKIYKSMYQKAYYDS